jgi:hypothetical protein
MLITIIHIFWYPIIPVCVLEVFLLDFEMYPQKYCADVQCGSCGGVRRDVGLLDCDDCDDWADIWVGAFLRTSDDFDLRLLCSGSGSHRFGCTC